MIIIARKFFFMFTLRVPLNCPAFKEIVRTYFFMKQKTGHFSRYITALT